MNRDIYLIIHLMKLHQEGVGRICVAHWAWKWEAFNVFLLYCLAAEVYVHFPQSRWWQCLLSSYNKPWEIEKVAAIDRRWPGNKSNQGWRRTRWASSSSHQKFSRCVNKRRNTFWGTRLRAKRSLQFHTFMYLAGGHLSSNCTFSLSKIQWIVWDRL